MKYPVAKDEENTTRVIPKDMNFIWAESNDVAKVIKLHFDQTEIMSAFENLSDDQPKPLKLEVRYDNNKHDFSVWLHNAKDAIELKKTKFEEYGAGPKMY